uniref:Uncharacterized protein n=1 Tax=Aegilops tauschii subsp. strangulata TaxID=200361 RepID=A0A453H219_AEGTS
AVSFNLCLLAICNANLYCWLCCSYFCTQRTDTILYLLAILDMLVCSCYTSTMSYIYSS